MTDDKVVLRNRSRFKPFQFTLYHRIVCAARGECLCGKRAAMGFDQRGEFVQAEQAVYISPRGVSKPLPREVLLIPQVRCALTEEPPFIEVANKLADVEVVLPAVTP